MISPYVPDANLLGSGLLIVRLIIGGMMMGHGSQKLFGWFGGHGLAGTGGFFESLGFRPGRLFATVAATTELVAGALILLGLFGPVGPALLLSVMIVAMSTVHWKNGVFATTNGIEVPLLYATVAVALALTGPGRYSLDALFGLEELWTPLLSWVILIVGAVGGIANVMARRMPKAG